MSDVICVTNRWLCREDFLTRIERIAAARPYRVILREKDLDEAAYAALAEAVHTVCERYQVPLALNGHPVLAARMELPVQLGFAAAEAMQAAKGTGASDGKAPAAFGVSVHSAAEAAALRESGASWMIAGHIWETDCKIGLPGRGAAFLHAVVHAAGNIPVYAIGGVTPERMPAVRKTGAAGTCVMSALMTCADPAAYLAAFAGTSPQCCAHTTESF
ncbi:MAG: thiamine phosphate synthase [Novosphingobium sp.]